MIRKALKVVKCREFLKQVFKKLHKNPAGGQVRTDADEPFKPELHQIPNFHSVKEPACCYWLHFL